MKFLLTSLYIILLQNSSKQHYIPPPHHCLLAKICNHTGTPMCGIEKEQLHKRIFLDDCDMFEYNCDNHKAYSKTELSDCTVKETEKVVLSTTTTTQMSSTITTERLNFTTQNIVTNTLSTSTITSDLETPTTIPITSIKSSSFSPKTENISTITESTFVTTTKSSEITVTPCTRAKGNETNKNNNLNIVNETTTNLTNPMNTMLSTQALSPSTSSLKTNTSVLSTTPIITTLSNFTKIESTVITPIPTTSVATIVSSKTTEYIKLNDATIAGNKKNVSSSTRDICEKYPKNCDRPHTWETTVKGETRDFFQILKARFGSRVKVLRDTTHFPQHLNKSLNYLRMSVNENNELFHYGKHNEG